MTGLLLPLVAGLWQLSVGILRPNWAAQYVLLWRSQYFDHLGNVLMSLMFVRPMLILEFLAFFSLPFVFLVLLDSVLSAFSILSDRVRKLVLAVLMLVGLAVSTLMLIADWIGIGRTGFGLEQILILFSGIFLSLLAYWLFRLSYRFNQFGFYIPCCTSPKLRFLLLVVFTLYIAASILYRHFASHESIFMPYIGWNWGILAEMSLLGRGILTLFTSMGAALSGWVFTLRYLDDQRGYAMPQWHGLLDLATLCLASLRLIYGYIADEHLLGLLPFTLIVVGHHLGDRLHRYRKVTILALLVVLLASTMWTRGLLASSEAYWQGGEFALSIGAQPHQVHGSLTRFCYYRFSDYLAEVPAPALESEDDFFFRWRLEQQEHAEFWVTENLDTPDGEKWEVLKEIPYQDALFRERRVYVVRREKLHIDGE
ncbi:MAG: hypothetical protein ACUVR2_11265 [Anaerolineae bacterium]